MSTYTEALAESARIRAAYLGVEVIVVYDVETLGGDFGVRVHECRPSMLISASQKGLFDGYPYFSDGWSRPLFLAETQAAYT